MLALDIHDGDVKSAAAEVINEHARVGIPAKAVGNGRCGGFVYDGEDVQTRNDAGLLCRGAAGVVKICGHGYDNVAYLALADILLCVLTELAQDK